MGRFKGEIRNFLFVGVAVFLVYSLAFLVMVLVLLWANPQLPDVEKIEAFKPPQATTLYDRHGRVIYQFFEERREYVSLSEISPALKDAFISLEDRRFYRHWGIDVRRTFTSFLVNLLSFRIRQGGSTITQQLARNMFLGHERTIKRKILEFALALKLEATFTKDEILERYLNQIYFGEGVYGVQSASRFFFGKNAKDIDINEAALLAGLPKNPSGYSPYKYPQRAESRRKIVLSAMLNNGVINKRTYDSLLKNPPKLQPRPKTTFGGDAPYFAEIVRLYVAEKYGEDFLYRGGGKIYTTLDLDLQRIANDVIRTSLDSYEKKWKFLKPKYSEYKGREPKYLQVALIAYDTLGGIMAYVGGRDFQHSQFDRVRQAKRQPGSAFKVFVYTAAFSKGYSPGDTIRDEPIEIMDELGRIWSPKNYDEKYEGVMNLRRALALSKNIPAVKLTLDVGPSYVADIARKMGITSNIKPYPSMALGGIEVTLWDITRAFGTLMNKGKRFNPYFITRIEDVYGNILEENNPSLVQVLDPNVAKMTTYAMTYVVCCGTASNSSAYGWDNSRIPAAGKTGTTDDYKDTWFIGFSPYMVVGVWVGYDSLRVIFQGATGSELAVPIWAKFMVQAHKNLPRKNFEYSGPFVFVNICQQS
ncbi:MAG: transglycosylase domain-containing protein, partial [Candidatus Caldipriscus sp.]